MIKSVKYKIPSTIFLTEGGYMYIQWQMAGGYAHTFEAKKKCNKRTFRKEHLMHSFMFFTIFKFTTATLREPVTAFLLKSYYDENFCFCSQVFLT